MKKITILIISLNMCFISACVDFSRETLHKRIFSIQLQHPPREKKQIQLQGILKIRRMQINPTYAGRNFIYLVGPGEYESDYYNEFIIPPDINITAVTGAWFETSDTFSRVATVSSQLAADYILESNIHAIYGDFSKDQATAIVDIKFLLLKAENSEPVFEDRYKVGIEIQSHDASDLIKGYHTALSEILSSLEQDINKKLHIDN